MMRQDRCKRRMWAVFLFGLVGSQAPSVSSRLEDEGAAGGPAARKMMCAGSNLDLGLDLSPGLGSGSAWSGARHGCTGRWEAGIFGGGRGTSDRRRETRAAACTSGRQLCRFQEAQKCLACANSKWGGSLHYPMGGHWAAAGVASLFRARLSLCFFFSLLTKDSDLRGSSGCGWVQIGRQDGRPVTRPPVRQAW